MANYSHPGCYANKTNECSTKISGEHIISNNILELFEQNNTVKVAGMPWIENKTFNLLSRKSLVSNILCTDHNKALSLFDSEAGKLFRCIKEFDHDFLSSNPKNEIVKLNGLYIEKWMLKIVCGMIASKQIALNGVKTNPIMKDIFIDLLFKDGSWSDNWGLYFKIPENKIIKKYNSVCFIPMIGDNEVKAAEFWIHNFKFYLVLGKPDQPDFWGIYRINKFHFIKGTVTKTLELDWGNKIYNQSINLTSIHKTKEPPSEWDDWMKE